MENQVLKGGGKSSIEGWGKSHIFRILRHFRRDIYKSSMKIRCIIKTNYLSFPGRKGQNEKKEKRSLILNNE